MSMRALIHHPKIPERVRRAFYQAIVSTSAEQVLWREAAARHVLDAFEITGCDELAVIEEARTWFRDCYDDVVLLFEFAGVDHEPVVEELAKFLQEKAA